jgi:hypothetical protein
MRRYLALILPVFLLGACESSGLSSQGSAAAEFWFETLPQMVATSDVVFLGTVVEVRDGTTEGPPGEEIEHLDAVVRVDEALFGLIDESATLTVQTLKFVEPEREWREVGATVLAFLKQSPDREDEGRYYLNLVVDGDILGAVEGDRLSDEIASMSIEEVREAIATTTPSIEAGVITPQPPVGS